MDQWLPNLSESFGTQASVHRVLLSVFSNRGVNATFMRRRSNGEFRKSICPYPLGWCTSMPHTLTHTRNEKVPLDCAACSATVVVEQRCT